MGRTTQAAEPTSSDHLTGGFAWERSVVHLSSDQRPWQGPAPCGHKGKQLRGDLAKELPFSFERGQRMDHLPLLVFLGVDLKPF